ncbi:unnamed protein product [Symbiodinium sp. KB8]|nr:unnamed protein product [Symbiodinium sp. KB8]
MAAASPEVVRGIPLFRLVRLAPLYWLRGELQRLHHRSEVVTEFDEFWSHSWQASAGSKCINILMRTNGVPAFLLSMVSVMLATLLARLEILHPRDRFGAAWCVLLGSLVYYSTLLLWRQRRVVFLDLACINQTDRELKAQGIGSLGAILKASKSMSVMWDATYATRLWCMFELAAFLHSRPAESKAEIMVCPPLLGPIRLGIHFGMLLLMLVYWPAVFFGGLKVLGGAAFVCLCWAGHTVRAYWRDVDMMEKQAGQFSIARSLCSCCDAGTECNKLTCDRRIIAACIRAWFGSIAIFEERVHYEERKLLANRLCNNSITYFEMVQAAAPILWLGLDVMATRENMHFKSAELAKDCARWLAIVPFIMKLCLRLTYSLRARCCTVHVDILVSCGIVAVAVALFLLSTIIDLNILQRLIPDPLYANLTSLGIWGLAAALLWRVLPEIQAEELAPLDMDSPQSSQSP